MPPIRHNSSSGNILHPLYQGVCNKEKIKPSCISIWGQLRPTTPLCGQLCLDPVVAKLQSQDLQEATQPADGDVSLIWSQMTIVSYRVWNEFSFGVRGKIQHDCCKRILFSPSLCNRDLFLARTSFLWLSSVASLFFTLSCFKTPFAAHKINTNLGFNFYH